MLQIDASLIVIFLIVWVLVFALSRLFFNPLRKVMRERATIIKENKESFQKSMEVYEQTISDIEERLKSAKSQAQQTKENIGNEALKEKERLLSEVNIEYRNQVKKAKKQLEKQMK
ncbi:MAG: hypothetical protein WBC02_03905, partial [Candidatus Aminicenantaceae bacterium]